jgi:hypothetical protein
MGAASPSSSRWNFKLWTNYWADAKSNLPETDLLPIRYWARFALRNGGGFMWCTVAII